MAEDIIEQRHTHMRSKQKQKQKLRKNKQLAYDGFEKKKDPYYKGMRPIIEAIFIDDDDKQVRNITDDSAFALKSLQEINWVGS